MIEGHLTDFQFCAEKIFHYAENIGHLMDVVHIRSVDADGQMFVFISITAHDVDDRPLVGSELIPAKDVRCILHAGYCRVEMMMSELYTKH